MLVLRHVVDNERFIGAEITHGKKIDPVLNVRTIERRGTLVEFEIFFKFL